MKFSVIIPVYNKADQIIPTIESVFRQEYKDFEIVLVNDGSTDNLLQVLQPYEHGIRIISQENGGVSVARNTGIRASKGEFVCFLDGDDEWLPNHLSVLNELTNQYPGNDVYITSHIVHYPSGTEVISSSNLGSLSTNDVYEDFLGILNDYGYGLINSNSMCIRRSFLNYRKIAFEPGVRIGEDTDVWYRAALYSNVIFSCEPTTIYHRENSTATKGSFFTENWIFSLRENVLTSDPDIPDQRKKSYLNLLDRYRFTCTRELMMKQQRKAAKQTLNTVRNKSGKRYWLMFIFCRLPYKICRVAYRKVLCKER